MYKHFFKRLFDFCIALVALIIISPLLLVITVWLHFANKKGSLTPNPSPKGEGSNWLQQWLEPAIFLQERPGKGARIFKVIKFKTMTDERGPDGELLSNAERLTKVGRFVRAASLDELPQLINVVKGDMALIGPRPLLTWFLPLYDETQMRRHEVRPGITGWAQVNGRNTVTYGEKFKYDVWYVDHLTMWLDIKILWMTVMNVLKRSDVGEGASDMKDIDDLHFSERLAELRKKNSMS